MSFKKAHLQCPDCGSSDALAVNEDGSSKCFSCGVFRPSERLEGSAATSVLGKPQKPLRAPPDAFAAGFEDRSISMSTASAFGVLQDSLGSAFFPYYHKDTLVGWKERGPEKTFKWEGDAKAAGLFGAQLFKEGGKYVTIFEGELDALAGYQMMGSKWPAVSVKNGAQGALNDCKASFQFLDSFDNIVICFDNDAAGKDAALKVAELFGGKALLFPHHDDYKDACEYLQDRKGPTFLKAWWDSKPYKPEGIVSVGDIMERLLTPPEPGVPWAFDTLTELTYGRRKGEIYTFGAGVGVGKTDVFTQQIAYDTDVLGKKCGVIYLEQNVVETVQRIAGKLDRKLYHIPGEDWTTAEYHQSLQRLQDRDTLMLFDHWGTMEWEKLKGIMRFFRKAYDIEHIYLDHLTALSANAEDERRSLDAIMADMAGLAQNLGVVLHVISHLATPEGKPHEEGGRVMEKHFRGSRAIAQWSHFMFDLERNKQAEDPLQRQTTTFRILKDRFTGRGTGMKFGLLYNQKTGILTETALIDEEPL